MLHTVKKLITNLKLENVKLQEEVKDLKQKLQYRHTEINDLRYTKKLLMGVIHNDKNKFRNGR